jgi:alpha-L-fucosidase
MDFTKRALKKPVIRKLGTIACDFVEATPIAYMGKLYRFEYVRPKESNPKNDKGSSYFRFVDLSDNSVVTELGKNHHLGCAYTDSEFIYVSGMRNTWGGDTVTIFRSYDLAVWEEYPTTFPGWGIFNTGICKMNGIYTLLMEINSPVEEAGKSPFTFRFAQSDDMINWRLTPSDCVFQKDRYAGGPAIYTFPGDPNYYVLYLEALPGGFYTTCIARGTDLKTWEYSPVNPVLMYDAAEDKRIANPFLTQAERERIEFAHDVNNSDMELCEWNGQTIITYSWGNQHGNEFLAEAVYDGTPHELLSGFFYND